MTLRELKSILIEKKVISLQGIMQLYNASRDDVESLMEYFIHRGKVKQKTLTPNCGSKCNQCPTSEIQLYQWRA